MNNESLVSCFATPNFFYFLLIAFRHSATSAMIETVEVVELLLILLLQLWTHHSGSLADALHDHDLTDAVVLGLEEWSFGSGDSS